MAPDLNGGSENLPTRPRGSIEVRRILVGVFSLRQTAGHRLTGLSIKLLKSVPWDRA